MRPDVPFPASYGFNGYTELVLPVPPNRLILATTLFKKLGYVVTKEQPLTGGYYRRLYRPDAPVVILFEPNSEIVREHGPVQLRLGVKWPEKLAQEIVLYIQSCGTSALYRVIGSEVEVETEILGFKLRLLPW